MTSGARTGAAVRSIAATSTHSFPSGSADAGRSRTTLRSSESPSAIVAGTFQTGVPASSTTCTFTDTGAAAP